MVAGESSFSRAQPVTGGRVSVDGEIDLSSTSPLSAEGDHAPSAAEVDYHLLAMASQQSAANHPLGRKRCLSSDEALLARDIATLQAQMDAAALQWRMCEAALDTMRNRLLALKQGNSQGQIEGCPRDPAILDQG